MTPSPDVDTLNSSDMDREEYENYEVNPLDELPDEVEMSFFDHLEELRQRIFYSLIVVVVAVIGCFWPLNPWCSC